MESEEIWEEKNMERYFNVEGACYPEEHYMVDITERLEKIKVLVDKKKYFIINRGRQYGKTTTLEALAVYLQQEYIVIHLDFQFLSCEDFSNEFTFVRAFAGVIMQSLQGRAGFDEMSVAWIAECARGNDCGLSSFFRHLSSLCAAADKPVVLMIDEADSITNNQVFVDFLALLRGYYLQRRRYATFQSVILAGVYDIKRVKQKIRPDEEHRSNSPWNIAADFDIEMDLNISGIRGMLAEYEQDYRTGMDVKEMADMLYAYTAGYPFLVSRLCKLMDEKIAGSADFPHKASAWTKEGFLAAEKRLLIENNPLFGSLVNKLFDYPELRKMLYAVLWKGDKITYNVHNEMIEVAAMFGFVKNADGNVAIANRIFETLLYNLFLSEEEINSKIYAAGTRDKMQFVQNGILNMDYILEKFMVHWGELYSSSDEKFIEDNGRKFFLLYLMPIINGTGNYYIESQTRDHRRTDVIVDYHGIQYIIEIKIWRGDEYNQREEAQLAGYLEAYSARKGYLLSFNFNKNKQTGMKEIVCGEKTILEVVV